MSKKLDDDAVEALDHAAIFAFMNANAPAATAVVSAASAAAAPALSAETAAALASALQRVVARAHDSLENDAPRKVKYEALAMSCVAAFVAVEYGATASSTVLQQAVEVAAKLGTLKERAKEAKINAKVLKKVVRCAELVFVAAWQRLSSEERAACGQKELVQELRREAIELRWKHRALQHAVCAFDGEPIVVLHPAQGWGARVVVRGVSDNAQLHWLLVAQLHAALPAGKAEWNKPPADVMAVFTGEKHQNLAVGEIDGVFNMYNWFALDSSAQLRGNYHGLPNAGSWVWVEGTPSDIDVCDSLPGEKPVRVVLLGPVPYKRRISIARDFVHMKAAVEVQSLIADADVKKFVDALAAIDDRIKLSSARRVRLETNVGREEVEQHEVQLVPAHMLFGPAA